MWSIFRKSCPMCFVLFCFVLFRCSVTASKDTVDTTSGQRSWVAVTLSLYPTCPRRASQKVAQGTNLAAGCFGKSSLMTTSVYLRVSMADFLPRGQIWVISKETLWPANLRANQPSEICTKNSPDPDSCMDTFSQMYTEELTPPFTKSSIK